MSITLEFFTQFNENFKILRFSYVAVVLLQVTATVNKFFQDSIYERN